MRDGTGRRARPPGAPGWDAPELPLAAPLPHTAAVVLAAGQGLRLTLPAPAPLDGAQWSGAARHPALACLPCCSFLPSVLSACTGAMCWSLAWGCSN